MKIRYGFVSNSSSTSFIITNTTTKIKTLVDFVNETPHMVDDFNREYDYHFTMEEMIQNAEARNEKLLPGDNEKSYGDEDGDVIGHVYDYQLRDGGKSKSFIWKFLEYNR